jgi:hypothetical protein
LLIVYWFTFNPRTAHPDIQFLSHPSSNDNRFGFDSITCLSSQERVALGSRGFDVLRENMLGKKFFFFLQKLLFSFLR